MGGVFLIHETFSQLHKIINNSKIIAKKVFNKIPI